MDLLSRTILLALLSITLINCSYAAGGYSAKEKSTVKGATRQMNTYRIGRFAIDVPVEFKVAHREHEFRLVGIEEFAVPDPRASVQYAERKWRERLDEIKKLDKPRGVQEIVIKQQTFDGLGPWSNGVLYYHDYITVRRGRWEIWVDYGRQITVFKLVGLISAQETMLSWMMEVVRAYRPLDTSGTPNIFYTGRGVIELPYKRQESSHVQFRGPMEMVLEVEMKEIQESRERVGIVDRTIAAMAAGFARGIEVEKIRGRKRVEAGLSGEEEIIQGTYQGQRHLNFDWEYLGEAQSGERPMVQISMDTFASNLPEKIGIWDEILCSFRALHK